MSNEFPFIGAEIVTTEAELPVFKQPAWDFENDRFLYDGNGRHIILTEKKAIEVWIYKALKTERFSYLAYSWQYGIELYPFIGKVMGVQERYSELKRVIIECLMVNPYITSIDSVDFEEEKHGNSVSTRIQLTTVYGEVSVNV